MYRWTYAEVPEEDAKLLLCVLPHEEAIIFSHQHHIMLTDVVLISSFCCVFCHTKKPLYFSHQHHIMLTDVVLISSCFVCFATRGRCLNGYPRYYMIPIYSILSYILWMYDITLDIRDIAWYLYIIPSVIYIFSMYDIKRMVINHVEAHCHTSYHTWYPRYRMISLYNPNCHIYLCHVRYQANGDQSRGSSLPYVISHLISEISHDISI